jgi:hypothetical protein
MALGLVRGPFRSRVRRGKSAHACSSNSCFAWLGLGFASIQLHAEHPQAAKLLSSSHTSCLATAEHSPTGWSGLLGQFRALYKLHCPLSNHPLAVSAIRCLAW